MNRFRGPLRPILRLLMALPLCAAAAPAAAVDVDEVLFIVTTAESSETSDDFTVEIRVTGTDLNANTSTIQFPNVANPFVLDDDGADLALGIEFDSEAALLAAMAPGNYVLRVANNTAQATIAYEQRPPVPSPAIDEPGANAVLPPGPLSVLFTGCSVCNFAGDSVEAELEGDATASETLTSADDEWTPPDGMGGDLQLGEAGEFLTRITHTAVREKNVIVSGEEQDADDLLKFSALFVRSDEVGFRTGFNPPEGDFCLVVNDPTPPAGCSPLDDELLSLLDTSGMFSTTVDGHAVDYTIAVDSKGTLTGNAMADLGGDAAKETVGAIKGKLKGKAGELKQKLSFPLVNEGLAAKLKVSVSEELSIPLDSLESVQKASGSLGATKVKEETTSSVALPFPPLGWRVNFTVAADGAVSNGLLTLDGGRNFPLEGSHKFNLATNQSSLKLQSADKGIKLQLKKVELDDEVAPTAVVGGDLSYKILGQSGKAGLPAP